ncbi:MAG TPA: cupin domain-containing protein [Bacteroidetes bacterium]|nr:cupin domain-containing protein [Bacteroidota bacterium]
MSHQQKNDKGVEDSRIYRFREFVEYADGGIVSKQILKKKNGNITLFAFDAGEGLSEHTSPFDALIQVIEGEARITIGKKDFNLGSGESIIMPADISHAVLALQRFKMILTMIR